MKTRSGERAATAGEGHVASVSVRWLSDAGLEHGTLEDVPRALDSPCVWVDVLGAEESTLLALSEHFTMHPLSIEDCLHFPQRPKLDGNDGSLFMIWIAPFSRGDEIVTSELDVFLGERWLVTVHHESLAAVDAVVAEAPGHLELGPDWLLHALIDRLVDDIFPVVDELSDRLDQLQDDMLERAERTQLEQLYDTRRDLLKMHKLVAPERDLLRALVRDREVVSQEAYRYFQDVSDHLARVEDSIDTYREVAAAAMDIYLSAQSNRMNAIMKQLTIVATIFMPLTLITGVYGMNFRYLPELGWKYGYFGVLAGMFVIAAAMLAFFKSRDWW